MEEKFDVKELATKYGGSIEIHIHNCTVEKVMEIAKDLGEINGEYWSKSGSSGVRFIIGKVKIHIYFSNEGKKEEV